MSTGTRVSKVASALVALRSFLLLAGPNTRAGLTRARRASRFALWLAPLLMVLVPSVEARAGDPPATFQTGHVYWAGLEGDDDDGVFDVTAGGTTRTELAPAVAPDGYGQFAWSLDLQTLYLPQTFDDSVLAITAAGGVSTFVTGIIEPTGLVMTTDGHLLVASLGGAVYDITSQAVGAPFATGFNGPFDMVQLANQHVLVADDSGTVFEIAYPAATVTVFASIDRPAYGIALRADGHVMVGTDGPVYDVTAGGDLSGATPFATGWDFIALTLDGQGRLLSAPFEETTIFDISAGGDFSTAATFASGLPGPSSFALNTVPGPFVSPALAISPASPLAAPLGSITFSATGGVGPTYTFAFAPGGNLSGGTIDGSGDYVAGAVGGVTDTIQVTDSGSSVLTTTVAVTAALAITNIPQPSQAFPAGAVDFTASGGTGAGTYAWSMVTSGSGVPTIGLSTGVYVAGAGVPGATSTDVVQVIDGNGAVVTATIIVGESITISIDAPSGALPPLGSVGLSAVGGNGVYTWAVTTDNSDGASVAFTSPPGTPATYTAGGTGGQSDTVTATDSLGNTATVQIAIGNGVSISPTDQSVAPRQTLAFSALGGNGDFTYSLTNPSPSGGTIAGTLYTAGPNGNTTDTVTATDTLGNTASTSVNVGPPVTIAAVEGTTTAPLGTLLFDVSGGSGTGYTWAMQSAPSGGLVAGGAYAAGSIGPATDVVEVTDSLLNTALISITVTASVALSPTSPTTPPRGSIPFAVTGGAPPYMWTLQANGSIGQINFATGAYTAGSAGGTSDTVVVTDSNGAVASTAVQVTAGVTIAPAVPTSPPLGAVAFTASGGTGGPYTWSIPTLLNLSGGTINAATGAYTAGSTGQVDDTVQVLDGLLNIATVSVSVGGGVAISPSSPTLPPRVTVTFGVTGGSHTGYVWTLPTNHSGATINATTGEYHAGGVGDTTDTLRVTDSLGGTASTPVHVSAGVLIAPATPTVAPLGTVAFDVSGGNGLGYLWSLQAAPSGGTIGATSGQYQAGVVGGVDDIVTVTDSFGNTDIASVIVTAAVSLAPATSSVAPRASVAFTASGGAGTYVFSLQTSASGGSITAAGGAYIAGPTPNVTDVVQVTDGNGAVAIAPVNVGAAVTITPAVPAVAPLGALQFAATGGSGEGFLWTLATDQSGGAMTAAGAYAAGATGKTVDVVHVVDSLGNVASAAVSVGGGLAIDPTSPSTPPKGAIVFTAVGGSGGFVWSLVTNASGATLDAISGAYVAGAAGNVSDVVGAKDSNGSTATTSVKVGPGIVVSPATAEVSAGFTLAFAVQGGSGAGYVWTLATDASGGTIGASTGAYAAGNTAGTDLVVVTDSLGNTGGASVTVKGAPVPTGDAGVDSGVADASSDAAPEHDAAPGADSGFALDAGARDAAADGGKGTSPSQSCGCRVVDASASNMGGALGALLGLALVVRRRRRG